MIDGGQAFPTSGRNYGYVEDGREGIPCDTGMTLRDYFAVHASDEDVACYMPDTMGEAIEEANEEGIRFENMTPSALNRWLRVRARYPHADNMLAERNRHVQP